MWPCTLKLKLKQCQDERGALAALVETQNNLIEGLQDDLLECRCGNAVTELEKRIRELEGSVAQLTTTNLLLTGGPPQPADSDLRVAESWLLELLYQDRFGAKYPAGLTAFSDQAFWVCRKENVDVYCAYLRDIWLPHVKPYTVVNWKKLNGDDVQIYQIDCDNFASFGKGITAAHGRWAGLAWNVMWANVRGVFMAGPHAFENISTWEDGYDEEHIDHLEHWTLEPQVMQTWEVELPMGTAEVGQVIDVLPVPAAGFGVEAAFRSTT